MTKSRDISVSGTYSFRQLPCMRASRIVQCLKRVFIRQFLVPNPSSQVGSKRFYHRKDDNPVIGIDGKPINEIKQTVR